MSKGNWLPLRQPACHQIYVVTLRATQVCEVFQAHVLLKPLASPVYCEGKGCLWDFQHRLAGGGTGFEDIPTGCCAHETLTDGSAANTCSVGRTADKITWYIALG